MKKGVLLFVIALIFGSGFAITMPKKASADFTQAQIKVIKNNGKVKRSFLAFESAFKGGAFLATGDVNNDGVDEIVVGAGPGGGPRVKVFTKTGKCIWDFMAFETSYKGGIDVAVGNVDGKGVAEIIVTKATDSQGWVRVFRGKKLITSFLAMEPQAVGGASVSAGDVNGDGKAEIVVGSGVGAKAHVNVFTGNGKFTGKTYFPFEDSYRGGVDVAVGNFDGGRESEIAISKARFSNARIKVYKYDRLNTVIGQFDSYPANFQEGANIDTADIDHDGKDEIITGKNGQTAEVRSFEVYGKRLKLNTAVYGGYVSGGVRVAVGNFDKNNAKTTKLIAVPGRKYYTGRNQYRYIEVSLANQELYVYQGGKVIKDFLISSGVYNHPSPVGDFQIYTKLLMTRMKGEYPDNPSDNYDIPDVKYVMPFSGGYTIHAAYWHNNFGHPMSHGCINMSTGDAEWLYGWSVVGDSVYVTPW